MKNLFTPILIHRAQTCLQNNLCFISLKPLEQNLHVLIFNHEIETNVKVLTQYITK